MANSNLIDNNVAGSFQQAPELFVNALEAAPSVEKNYLRIIPNIKAESVMLNKLTVAGGLSQADGRDCAWDAGEAAAVDAKEVELGDEKVNLEQCIDALDSIMSQAQYAATKRGELAPSFEQVLMDRLNKALGQDIEYFIWRASASGSDNVDGIEAKLAADEDVVIVEGDADGLGVTNIKAEVAKVYDAIPQAVLDEADFAPVEGKVRIFMNSKAYRFLLQALSTASSEYVVVNPGWTMVDGVVSYLGVEIAVAGLSDNTMIAAAYQNLVLCTNLLEDAVLKGERGKNMTDENIYYIKAQYRIAADYIFSDEVVFYQPGEGDGNA